VRSPPAAVRAAALALVVAAAPTAAPLMVPAPVAAQSDGRLFDARVSPGWFTDGESAFGLRYALESTARPAPTLDLSFPREWSWSAALDGAWATESAAVAEPLARGRLDLGMMVVLKKQRPCTLDVDCTDLVDLDLGYVLAGVRARGEVGQGGDESEVAAALSLLYRPLREQTGIWLVVPSVLLDYGLARTLGSEVRNSAGTDETDVYTRLDLGLLWTLHVGQLVDGPLAPLRFDAEWRRYWSRDADQVVDQLGGDDGAFLALGAAYDLTGRLPYLREVLVRWAEGEHPTEVRQRKAWLLALSFGPTP
jgi:hypothetical protein